MNDHKECSFCGEDKYLYQDQEIIAQLRHVPKVGWWLYVNIDDKASSLPVMNCPWCGRKLYESNGNTSMNFYNPFAFDRFPCI